MNAKTIKMIERCAVIQGRSKEALRAEWARATPQRRGRLRRRWQDHASQLVAIARKRKAARYA